VKFGRVYTCVSDPHWFDYWYGSVSGSSV
jgi:hypothetical protein